MGPDQPTSIGQPCTLIATEPRGVWSTNLRIAKIEKVKYNTLSHIYPCGYPLPSTHDRCQKRQRYRKFYDVLKVCIIYTLIACTCLIKNEWFNSLKDFGILDGDTDMWDMAKHL